MKFLNLIPACHSHLKNNPNRLKMMLSLAEQGCKERYPDITISQEQLFTFFHGAGIISNNETLPEKSRESTTDCFSIVSEYKCSFICQICPLSPRYKNIKDTEESALLTYALSCPQNFNSLKSRGVESKMFQSLFLVNPTPSGPLAATLPLNRLVFFYLECTANTLTSFSSLPADITAAIKRDNQEKLTEDNIKSINVYLKQIQKSYSEQTEDIIETILKDSYGLASKISTTKEEVKNSPLPEKNIIQPSVTQKEELHTASKEISKDTETVVTKNKAYTTKDTVQPSDINCLEGFLSQPPNNNLTDIKSPLMTKPALYMNKEPVKVNIVPENPEISVSDENNTMFLPSCFSASDNGGYPVIPLSMNSAIERQELLSFLLNHPKLALEVVTDSKTGRESLLIYGSGTFYLLDCADPVAASILNQFLSKSPVRNQICFDPYRLYNYYAKNNLPNHRIFSLRAAYTALAKFQKRCHLKTINGMILELTSRTNTYELPTYIFCMPYYLKMYEVITQNSDFQIKESQDLFMDISSINALLGISYDIQDYIATPSEVTLFELGDNLEIDFHYDKESMSMKSGIYSVTYTFANAHPSNNIAMEILYQFARKELMMKFSYRLLAFHKNSFTIATKEKDYTHLCEIVANMATHIATCKGLLPIYVSEDRKT